ncbi:hypothetical protein CBL_11247 [Carabus blaptoides fortunei]
MMELLARGRRQERGLGQPLKLLLYDVSSGDTESGDTENKVPLFPGWVSTVASHKGSGTDKLPRSISIQVPFYNESLLVDIGRVKFHQVAKVSAPAEGVSAPSGPTPRTWHRSVSGALCVRPGSYLESSWK